MIGDIATSVYYCNIPYVTESLQLVLFTATIQGTYLDFEGMKNWYKTK